MTTRNLRSVLKSVAFAGWVVLVVGLLLSAATVLVVGLLRHRGLCQAGSMHLSRTHWDLGRCGLVEGRDPELLVVSMHNVSTDITSGHRRVVVLKPADGAVLGELVTDGWLRPIGANTRQIWFSLAPRQDAVAAYSLPRLNPIYKQADLFANKPSLLPVVKSIAVDGMKCDLRVRTRDGRAYRLTPGTGELTETRPPLPPLAPTILSGWKRCAWKSRGRLYDHRGCVPAQVGEDRLTMAQPAPGFVISRKGSDGSVRWTVTEEQCFGERADEDVPRRIHYATVHRGKVLLLAQDGDDVYTAAIDVKDGRVSWSRTFR